MRSARTPQPEDGKNERGEEDLYAGNEPGRREERKLALPDPFGEVAWP